MCLLYCSTIPALIISVANIGSYFSKLWGFFYIYSRSLSFVYQDRVKQIFVLLGVNTTIKTCQVHIEERFDNKIFKTHGVLRQKFLQIWPIKFTIIWKENRFKKMCSEDIKRSGLWMGWKFVIFCKDSLVNHWNEYSHNSYYFIWIWYISEYLTVLLMRRKTIFTSQRLIEIHLKRKSFSVPSSSS